MKSLLRYNMSLRLESVSDEAVLAAFPTTVRRHILRALYRGPLSACYLFQGTGEKFLDALLMAARVELYKPQVGGCWTRGVGRGCVLGLFQGSGWFLGTGIQVP
jgi:hypothetical protein